MNKYFVYLIGIAALNLSSPLSYADCASFRAMYDNICTGSGVHPSNCPFLAQAVTKLCSGNMGSQAGAAPSPGEYSGSQTPHDSYSHNNTDTSQGANTSTRYGQAAMQCISFRNTKIGWVVYNSCNTRVYVKWYDQGDCNTGCGITVAPYDHNLAGQVTGSYRYAACANLGSPETSPGTSWNGSGRFYCAN